MMNNLQAQSPHAQVTALLSQMTLAEKIGQMTQVEKNSITPAQVRDYAIGSILSGGGGNPSPNTPESWKAMVSAFQAAALESRLRIPILYGSDGVHGHNNVRDAVIFPHNVGLGATRNPALVERIGEVTARELLATGVHWTFAPALSVPQDIRWGRAYEGYSEDPALVSELGTALLRGLQSATIAGASVIGTLKHFVADGGTQWGTTQYLPWLPASNWQAATPNFRIDQGDAQIDEATLRDVHLHPYPAGIAAGAMTVMVSFSSWNGVKLHHHRYLLTDVLRQELGFEGFIVSDWGAIDQLAEDYERCVVEAVNAGIDMIMVPMDYQKFIATLTRAVEQGAVPMARIDDAVSRILRVKLAVGIFENPWAIDDLLPQLGSQAHRAVARQAVQESLVLLKNEQVLPLDPQVSRLLVAGRAADDIGLMCGGWTVEWQGAAGAITTGKTLLDGIRGIIPAETHLTYHPEGEIPAPPTPYEVGIVVLAEPPYAEGLGDIGDLALSEADIALLTAARAVCERLLVILVSGRPRIITDQLPLMDALIMAWLPGSEADAIADNLFGRVPFTGKLPFSVPRNAAQIPLSALKAHPDAPLFPFGFGL